MVAPPAGKGDVLVVTSERCEMRPLLLSLVDRRAPVQAGLHALGAYYRNPPGLFSGLSHLVLLLKQNCSGTRTRTPRTQTHTQPLPSGHSTLDLPVWVTRRLG